ncbi:(Na+)-NQR maturation NqrM [Psychrosphaera aestuarii]|uniref:(Na+)-NQR maturation NqrM n=1 Tax=Psychrosphaera aestuarii TaxID=1266052 RepID=UPI001B33D0DD|nr:(Na+)-NQR maturation NqrM [Psychrosphaera aestuarii]
MQVFLLTLGLLLIVFVAMSIGYILQKKTLAGSCGGLGALGIDKACNCDNPCDRRKERLAKEERWKQDQIL